MRSPSCLHQHAAQSCRPCRHGQPAAIQREAPRFGSCILAVCVAHTLIIGAQVGTGAGVGGGVGRGLGRGEGSQQSRPGARCCGCRGAYTLPLADPGSASTRMIISYVRSIDMDEAGNRPIVEERRMLSVAPTQSRSSRFMMIASCHPPPVSVCVHSVCVHGAYRQTKDTLLLLLRKN